MFVIIIATKGAADPQVGTTGSDGSLGGTIGGAVGGIIGVAVAVVVVVVVIRRRQK